MGQIESIDTFEKIDIKEDNIDQEALDVAAEFAGGYEQVFSKRARKFRGEGWHEKKLTDKDYRKLILSEYTFLKRPVFFVDDKVYIGNSKKVVNQLIEDLNG